MTKAIESAATARASAPIGALRRAALAGTCALLLVLSGLVQAADPTPDNGPPAQRSAAATAPARGDTAQPVHVVYHLSEGIDQAARALNNIHNHLAADPSVHIVVVGLGGGVDFMVAGTKDSRGSLFEPTIRELSQQGVEFRVCSNTLRQRGIDPATLVPQATRVPAGVAEIARLQAREGYAYLRP